MPDADPATFTWVPMFNGSYVTYDKKHIWENNYPVSLKDADGATFKKISTIYIRDAHSVWALSLGAEARFVKLPDADPATFVAISEFFGKNKAHVYKETWIVAGADPATFKPPPSK